MSHTPLGEICVSLGLLTPAEVSGVLERMASPGCSGMRFGEVALEIGVLDDAGLSRALAQQFRLNLVPDDRVEKLQIAPEVLSLVSAGLMRERLLIPTFLEPEKRVLSLLTAAPTDITARRQVQAATHASRLRLFIGRSVPSLTHRRSLVVGAVWRMFPRAGAVGGEGGIGVDFHLAAKPEPVLEGLVVLFRSGRRERHADRR